MTGHCVIGWMTSSQNHSQGISPEYFFAGVCCGGLITLPIQVSRVCIELNVAFHSFWMVRCTCKFLEFQSYRLPSIFIPFSFFFHFLDFIIYLSVDFGNSERWRREFGIKQKLMNWGCASRIILFGILVLLFFGLLVVLKLLSSLCDWLQLGIGFLLRERPLFALATVATAVVRKYSFAWTILIVLLR